jgi:hypothetical protein
MPVLRRPVETAPVIGKFEVDAAENAVVRK